MMRSLLTSGLAMMVLSAFFFALTDVLVKFVSPEFAVTEIAFFRFVIGGAILLLLMAPRRISFRGNRTPILVARGVVGTLTFLSLLKSISMIPLANALVLFYTFPIFASFFAFILFRESLSGKEVILILIGLGGIYILIDPGTHVFNWGDIYGLLAGCSAGISVVLIRKLRETNNPFVIYFYYCLTGSIISFPFVLKGVRMHGPDQLLLLIILGIVFLIAQLLMTQGFKFCKASEGSVILMSEVVLTGIAGVLIFKDPLSLHFMTGAFFILGSGVGLNLMNRRVRLAQRSRATGGILGGCGDGGQSRVSAECRE
ncbi:MAG: EamA family transporter [Proteobacteria bacterium]|nr:EamA family transporter [Pseudomonadota bacterium]